MFAELLSAVVLVAAAAPIVWGFRFFRRHPSLSLVSYLFYLGFWNFQIIFTTAFLLYIRYLPKTGRLGFILFNAVLLIPIHAATAVFFADFLWRKMGRRPTWTARAVVAAPFLVVLVIYGKQVFMRLARDPAPSFFQVSAPMSYKITILIVLAVSVLGFLAAATGKDSGKKKNVMFVAGLTAAGMVLWIFQANVEYTDFQSYIWSGLIGVAVNIPAFLALAFSIRRTARGSAGGGIQSSLADGVGERYGLSQREREILAWVCRGRLNKEIARELHISLDTVKKHLYNIFKKTSVRSRLQLFLLVRNEPSSEIEASAGNPDRQRDRIPEE